MDITKCQNCNNCIADLRKENGSLRDELERERMRLAACGVVAMANTPESAKRERAMHPDYRSASLRDVEDAVDREMALRKENEELRKKLSAERRALELACRHIKWNQEEVDIPEYFRKQAEEEVNERIQAG